MSDHRDESLLDRIKSAFGMGDDGTDASPDAVRDDVPTTATSTAATPQAGFSEPFEEDLGDPANRPTGPDYGAGAGDGAAGYDDPYDTVAGPGPMGAGASDVDDAWTRGHAASGTPPFDPEEGGEGDVIEQERRETGI